MDKIDQLIIKYLSKNTSSQEQAELLEWLEMNEDNRIYFRSFKDAYDFGRAGSYMKNSSVQSQWTKLTSTIFAKTAKSAHTLHIYSFMRYAAIFIMGALLSYFIYSYSGQTKEEMLITKTKIETGIGERSKVTLPDGSTVWVNACSSITFDNTFGNEIRMVSLQGEAYFDVQTDSLKPFLVHTDHFTHRVTGTSFNVYSFSDEDKTSIALLEGGVTMEYGTAKEKLYPGEMFSYNKKTGKGYREKINVTHISSWRHGEFTFDNLTFEELVKRLERTLDVQFVFENKHITQERFGGTLRDNYSLDMILKVIKTSIPIRYKVNGNQVIIY